MQHMLDPDDGDAAAVDGADRFDQFPASPSVRPPAISSRRSSFGSVASARASSSRLRSRRVSPPAGTLARSARPVSTRISAQRSATSRSECAEPKIAADEQILEDGELAEGLRNWNVRPSHRRSGASAAARDVAAAEADAPAIEREVAGDQVEQRRLARAFGPMMPSASPSSTRRDRVGDPRAPKLFVTRSSSRIGTSPPGLMRRETRPPDRPTRWLPSCYPSIFGAVLFFVITRS